MVNGDPRMQLVVTLKITDAVDEDDDLLRNVYGKGQLQEPAKQAGVNAGEPTRDTGGRPSGRLRREGLAPTMRWWLRPVCL